ncbi:MAG: helix-turn-helix domain-containing protein [Clostridiales bacterium]|nr:helix-turn-helix domain-containing protein [Clostridiales bacterium]
MMNVGERIKAVRKKKGLSQYELAKRADISQSFLSYIERGEKSPTLRTLEKITKAMEIPLEELVEDIEKNNE